MTHESPKHKAHTELMVVMFAIVYLLAAMVLKDYLGPISDFRMMLAVTIAPIAIASTAQIIVVALILLFSKEA